MIDLLKKELKPAKDILGMNGPGLTPLQIREGLDSIVQTLDLLVQALEAVALDDALKQQPRVPPSATVLAAEPGLTPNPNSPPPTELKLADNSGYGTSFPPPSSVPFPSADSLSTPPGPD